MNMDRRKIGRWGEDAAAKFLKQKRYRILDRNVSCRFGEIDLIAETGGYLVFVEVKLRKNAAFAEAKEFVTAAKQRRVILTAQYWLAAHPTDRQPRFDVVEVYGAEGKIDAIHHIENAFTL